MKGLLIFLVSFSCVFTVQSQTFTFIDGDTIVKLFDVDDYTPAHKKIRNLADTVATFHWEIITFNHPLGWEFSLCDYPFCYTGGEMNGTMYPVPPLSEIAFLTVNVESTYPDTGIYQIKVWNESFPELCDTLTIIMISMPNYSELSPNLAQDIPSFYYDQSNRQIHGNNSSGEPLRLSLYSCNGQLIRSNTIPPYERININMTDIPEGYYILHLEGMKQVIVAQRFCIP